MKITVHEVTCTRSIDQYDEPVVLWAATGPAGTQPVEGLGTKAGAIGAFLFENQVMLGIEVRDGEALSIRHAWDNVWEDES